MTPQTERFSAIVKAISDRKFEDATTQIQRWADQEALLTPIDLRCIGHLKALIQIQKGELENALETLEEVLKNHGENLALFMEKACCHYQLGQWTQWRQAYTHVEGVLTNTQLEVDPVRKVEAFILLGKFHEEEGSIVKARDFYQSAVDMVPGQKLNLRFRAKTQLMRVEATFGSRDVVGNLYSELIQIQKNEKTVDLEIELEHALMLSEMNLVGPLHASERLLKILEMTDILEADKSLMLYDFLEECVVNKYEIPEGLSEWSQKIPPADEFETMIGNLVTKSGSDMSLTRLMGLSSQVTPSSYLRLLTLALRALPDFSREIKNKLHLLLSAVDGPSRHLWNKRIDVFTESSSKLLKFDLEKRVISFESKDIDLSRKRGMLVFAEMIAQNGEMSVEEMIEKIWQTEYTPDHFHRLRMTAHRMNQLLFDLTSIEKPIEVNADRIKLNPKIKFQCLGNDWNL